MLFNIESLGSAAFLHWTYLKDAFVLTSLGVILRIADVKSCPGKVIIMVLEEKLYTEVIFDKLLY